MGRDKNPVNDVVYSRMAMVSALTLPAAQAMSPQHVNLCPTMMAEMWAADWSPQAQTNSNPEAVIIHAQAKGRNW